MRHIHRRRFVSTLSLATMALATRPVRLAARAPRRIAVVGGGIMGASIAYHLAKRGAEVVLLEKRAPATGATANSFAWINAGSKRPRGYFELNHLGMAGWRRLQHELGPRLVMQWGGTVQWQSEAEKADAFRRSVAAQQVWGYSTRLVDAPEMRRLVPALEPGPVSAASFCDEEGTVDPVAATRLLLDAAVSHGAVVRHPATVSAFDLNGSAVHGLRVDGEMLAADAVVLATGVELPALGKLLDIDVPMQESPGLLAHTVPSSSRLLDRILVAPGATLKQLPSGEIVTGVDFGGSPSRDTSPAMGRTLLDGASRFVPRLKDATLDRVTLGFRVLPADGQPIIGRVVSRPNVYLAAMHSGITLSPAAGQLAAIELLDQVEVDLLKPYRLERFAK